MDTLRFVGKSTMLCVLTIGMIISTVPRVSGMFESSHQKRIQLFVHRHFLQILPNGIVNGTDDKDSNYTIFSRGSAGIGHVWLRSVATCRFLCMNSCGHAYSTTKYEEECTFHERYLATHYIAYHSVRWSTDTKLHYLGLGKHGGLKKVHSKNSILGEMKDFIEVSIFDDLPNSAVLSTSFGTCPQVGKARKSFKKKTPCSKPQNKKRRRQKEKKREWEEN